MQVSRIAYLSLEAPREGQASFTHVNEIVSGLRQRGIAVDLYIPVYTDRARSPGLMRRLLEYLLLQVRLLRRWRRYDAIYVRGHFMAFPVAWFARLARKPIVHEVNGPYLDIVVTYPWTGWFFGLLGWIQRVQYQWADGIAAVTPQLAQWLRAEGCRNLIEVIPNGANLILFNPGLERRAGLPDRYVVFFGGFARWQGISTMLQAIDDPAWPSDVSLVIVGDGQLRAMVEEAAGRHANLTYLRRLPYVEIGPIVAHALAGLVPKSRDNDQDQTGLFPIKLFEILACGVPAIVTDYPGQADLVRSADCGVVIPPENPPALAAAVAAVAADPQQRESMGRRAHELIVSEHSWARRAEQTAELIERAATRDAS